MTPSQLALAFLQVQERMIEARLATGTAAPDRKAVTQALERAVRRFVQETRPATILEIGAHRAEFSVACRRLLPEARIIALEANPVVHRANAARLAALGVDYLNLAAAAGEAIVRLHVPVRAETGLTIPSMGSLLPQATMPSTEHEVQAVALGPWLGEVAHEPSFLWIDVEGAVGGVLEGAGAVLDAALGLYVEVERTERWPGQWLDADVIRRLAGHGLVPVLRDVQKRGWQYNLLFLRESLLDTPAFANLCAEYGKRLALAGAMREAAPA